MSAPPFERSIGTIVARENGVLTWRGAGSRPVDVAVCVGDTGSTILADLLAATGVAARADVQCDECEHVRRRRDRCWEHEVAHAEATTGKLAPDESWLVKGGRIVGRASSL